MKESREFDVIVYGASGFTGQLIAEYLNQRYGVGGDLRWALAGRNADKISQAAIASGLPEKLTVIAADSADKAALAEMVARTRVMLTAVGPYQLYGSALLEACAVAGTDYVDLCGETNWMREMVIAHSAAAQASGARIVFSCGFDSIPFDLGVYYLQQVAKEKTGSVVKDVKGRVRKMKGHASGGTVASMKATMAAAMKDPAILEQLKNPYCLVPGFEGVPQPASHKPTYDEEIGSWAAPFIMAQINMPNVHRSNALLGHAYGEDFTYTEMLLTGPGEKGESIANSMAEPGMTSGDKEPQPGEGPSREEQLAGFYDILFQGESAGGETVAVSVAGDRDPGYGSTSRMIAESAVALACDDIVTPGGIWTPAAAMGDPLIKRLVDNAGLVFKTE
ncbi:saccharopine dehydrogenase family protein [Pseudohalioglobus lutimaris]|uniref:Saccharopine dehydrogenase n=1 Tax=Pseudohalioglobus lutimaris TaxID=1737061 RepID=A0A2N5WXH9_9GAMM|nr:saccharopine dehydrogenase NADP-binding domain-containing protein [Pseudohalioglobus lutimaris]PLW66941.1 saccharopine dehydrogenase [Pseudohalioglobus lutimaris]